MCAPMITLYGFSAAFGLPDLSPFVLKTATALRMLGLKYESQPGDPRTYGITLRARF